MVSELAENYRGCAKDGEVLILVVMEDGLRAGERFARVVRINRLNPCCYGRWSQRFLIALSSTILFRRLNPCCYGRWSQRRR